MEYAFKKPTTMAIGACRKLSYKEEKPTSFSMACWSLY